MIFYGEKPNYKRKKVRIELEQTIKIPNYDSVTLRKLAEYIKEVVDNLPTEALDEKIQVEFTSYEESQGFDYGHTYIEIQPYYMRDENDKEYDERIAEEEAEYKKYEETERLKKEEHEQYEKDMLEYKRIKEKYYL